MKVFTAVVDLANARIAILGLAVLISPGAQAQHRGGAPVQRMASPAVPTVGALGGSFANTTGALGGRFASTAMSRPLGGVVRPSVGTGNQRDHDDHGRNRSFRYFGPVYYVPNYYDTPSQYQSSGYSIFNQPADPALNPPAPPQESAPQQPIIINQYFNSRTATSQTGGDTTTSTEINPGDPIGTPQNYYLIAYKNHNVYSALAYWVEGDTLHYVTTQNTHNQASLSLIDLDRTIQLNADNSVPFSLSGK